MTRPTGVEINIAGLLHNLNQVKAYAPGSKIIAMVKANAYGNGSSHVVPILAQQVYAFGVACLEEALAIRSLGVRTHCILFQGVFHPAEWQIVAANHLQSVVHHSLQLQWLLENPLPEKIKIWVKVDTGMHRLGFEPNEIYNILMLLSKCPWVDSEIGLITHLACADEIDNPHNELQLKIFNSLKLPALNLQKSICNSAAIMSLPSAHAEVVRPGIMLYGVSPFRDQTGPELGLIPVMRFMSAITAIHHYPKGAYVGYGATWKATRPSVVGVVPAGYGDGYPRHIATGTPVWINGFKVPIVGRVSMDMLTIDLTDHPMLQIGDLVELWGENLPVEIVAKAAGTIAYELLCQFSPRLSGV